METKRIMIVEDENIIALDIKKSVKGFGYPVVMVVPSGEEAIEEAEKIHPDLILMDIVLKGKINGLEAGREIWKHYKVPIIYITSYFDDTTLRKNFHSNFAYDFLIKPFNNVELKSKIESALNS